MGHSLDLLTSRAGKFRLSVGVPYGATCKHWNACIKL